METDDLAHRSGLKAGGIVVTQVLLGREGELYDIVDGGDVIGGKVSLLKFMTVERDVVIYIVHYLVQALALEFAHLLARHGLFVGVPDHI